VVLAGLAIAAGSANAQSVKIDTDIPSIFIAGNNSVPSASYSFQPPELALNRQDAASPLNACKVVVRMQSGN
jgi:hypothetical protein